MKTFQSPQFELSNNLSIFALDCGISGIGDSGPLFYNFVVVIDKKHIEDIAKEALRETDMFLVDVLVSKTRVIQVFVDHMDGISLDDCATLHRKIEERLDREQEDFELQVSSPGLGQPIRVYQQYVKARGQKLEITRTDGESIKGILLETRCSEGEQEAELVIRQTGTKRKPAPEEPVVIPINRVKTARVEIDFKQV